MAQVLIKKLSDSKVVIRQAVLRACGLLIKNFDFDFMSLAISYCRHNNWHVREGVMHLLANCLISNSQMSDIGRQTREMSQTHVI